MIKVLIIEDQALLRDLLERVINEQADMEVVGVAGDASQAPELCRTLKPDLVLMDVVTENNSNGIIWAGRIMKEFSCLKTVIMTSLPEITFIDEARKTGVHSCVYKKTGIDHLLLTIRSTMKGIGIYPGPADTSPFAGKFTEKEIAVIRMVCQGKRRGEVLKEMGISEKLLKPIITSILDKSGFDNIMQFAVYALGHDLIAPELWVTL